MTMNEYVTRATPRAAASTNVHLIVAIIVQDSSLPCAVFVFTAVNLTNEKRDVSITFTWTEILGSTNKNKNSGM